jgi:hypothetical protein
VQQHAIAEIDIDKLTLGFIGDFHCALRRERTQPTAATLPGCHLAGDFGVPSSG